MNRSVVVFGALVLLAVACGGGSPFKEGGKAASEVKGRVIKGPVANATVVAYRADATVTRGEVLAQAKTDEAGDFELALPPYQGHVIVVATAGSYIEESIGLGVQLGDNELTLLLPDFTTGTKLEGVRLTPISTFATNLTRFHVGLGEAVATAHSDAMQHLHQHFGGVDWATVTPADLTATGVTNLSPESRAGLVLAGLSWLAKQQAETSEVTPGLVVNAATLTQLLAQDAADGTFDGMAATTPLKSSKVDLTKLTLRSELVQAMSGFINSSRNASALRLQDITALLATIGTNNDPYLFCPGQMAAASCGSGPVDTEPPVLAFIRPGNNAGVAGSTQVEVHASDNVKLKTFKFTAPESLATALPSFTNENREGMLTAMLDVSALADGPLEIRAEVTDESGNPAAKSITITVSNQGPRINFTAPGDGSTVRGNAVNVAVSAMAQAPGATIARIELVDAPAGMGGDVLPAADSFSATWNSSLAREGNVVLTVRALDTFGTTTESSITVVVDNVALGQVSATAFAGTPVDGLTVKLVAIDDATGLPVVGRMGGPILGQSSDVTADGGVSFTLTQENYEGPVQLVASGSSAAYVDPTDGTTQILLPSTFTMTSYLRNYKTGDRLEVPITLWTTLADEAARAYASGLNPSRTMPSPLSGALNTTNDSFTRHLTPSWNIRSTFPVRLDTTAQSLRDVVYAALPDVAFNWEARDIANEVGLTPGAFNAVMLVSQLREDIADGLFDGKAAGVLLQTAGTVPYKYDANTTRFRQATAMDLFIRGAQNRTGLTRQDLQTSGIYDTVSNDGSMFYPSSAGCPAPPAAPAPNCPIAFDNTAPRVRSLSIKFSNGSIANSNPLPPSRLVGGLVTIDVVVEDTTAVDPSRPLSVSVDGSGTLVGATSGNTPEHYSGTIDVRAVANGPLTFTISTCDRLNNCSAPSGQYVSTVIVDKSGPFITIAKPQEMPPLFASSAFEIQAASSDAQSSVASMTVTNPSGLVSQDPAPDQFVIAAAGWTLNASDGPFSVGYRSCDVVGNCSTAARTITVDKSPPLLTWTARPTRYSGSRLVSFSVSAVDGGGAGVSHVYAGVNRLNAVEGIRSGDTWTFTNFDLTIDGERKIYVWGADSAVPANSGLASVVPGAELNSDVLVDRSVPSLAPASYKPFKDEDAVTLVTGPGGLPVIPPQYDFGTAPNRVVDLSPSGFVLKKTTTLLSATTNRAMLTWAVPYNAANESPITGVTFTSNVNRCRVDTGNCQVSVGPNGSLTLDTNVPSPAANTRYYSLELNFTQPGAYSYTFTATDEAGNATQRNWSVVVQVFGAPLVIIPDTLWETSATDTNNALRLRIADKSYDRLFGTGLTLVGDVGRVRRYLVYNAAPEEVPVLFEGAPGNVRTTAERWLNSLGNLWAAEGDGVFTVGSSEFQRDMYYSTTPNFCANTNRTVEPWPCPSTAQNLPYPRHVRGSGVRFECIGNVRTDNSSNYGPLRYNNTVDSISVADDASVVGQYMSPAAPPSVGGETAFATNVGFGPTNSSAIGAKVPAATSTAPGVLSFYAAIPVQTHGGGLPQLTSQALPHRAGGNEYQYYYADFWDPSQANPPNPPSSLCNGSPALRFGSWWWYRVLQTSTTSVSATFTVKSGGLIFNGGLFGSPWSGATSRTLSPVGSSPFNIVH